MSRILLLMPLLISSPVSAQSYYADDGGPARPLAHGNNMQYRVESESASMTDTKPAPPETRDGLSSHTAAGVKTAVNELEAGLDDLKGYSIDMAAHLHRNGLQGFIDMPRPLTDQGTAIGHRLGKSIQSIGNGVRQDMIPNK